MKNYRATPIGKENNRKCSADIRATEAGRTKHRINVRNRMQNIRATEAGGIKHRIDERNRMQTTRDKAKADHDEKIAKIPFPPEFPPEKNIFETCVRNYIDATKPESLETIECGICGESVKKDSNL